MAPDIDLSDLQAEQVKLWIYLQASVIRGQIKKDQSEHLGFLPRSRGKRRFHISSDATRIFNDGRRGADAKASTSENMEDSNIWVLCKRLWYKS